MSKPSSRLAAERLANQRISKPASGDPAALVAWFGAVQAQEYASARWALALRLRGVTDGQITAALDAGRILRTHVLRPTWHFVAAEDIRWMLELTAPRVHGVLRWGHGQLGTDLALRRRAMKVIERALAAEGPLTRVELAERLARAKMVLKGTALALVVMHAELEGVVCSGPRRGKHGTYALLDARAPHAKSRPRDEALAELTKRYFASHGPATARDFAWWSGLTVGDARRGLDMVGARAESVDGFVYWRVSRATTRASSDGVHLLPIYDEYLVAYRDLAVVPRGNSRWGMLPQAIIVDGQVAGTWKAQREPDRLALRLELARRLTRAERDGLAKAAASYGRFHGVSASRADI